MGTVNLLEAVRRCGSVKAVLVVTSDTSYQNNEWHWGYRESEALGGHDPLMPVGLAQSWSYSHGVCHS